MKSHWDECTAALKAFTAAKEEYNGAMRRLVSGVHVPESTLNSLRRRMVEAREVWLQSIDRIIGFGRQSKDC